MASHTNLIFLSFSFKMINHLYEIDLFKTHKNNVLFGLMAKFDLLHSAKQQKKNINFFLHKMVQLYIKDITFGE